jgi:hypothetical protein
VGKKVKDVGKFPTGKNLLVCPDEWKIRGGGGGGGGGGGFNQLKLVTIT